MNYLAPSAERNSRQHPRYAIIKRTLSVKALLTSNAASVESRDLDVIEPLS